MPAPTVHSRRRQGRIARRARAALRKKTVESGQRLQPGQPLMAVVSDYIWVVANFKESQLKKLHVGEKVDVDVDAIGGRTFHGTLESFLPGTGAKFALLAPDNA